MTSKLKSIVEGIIRETIVNKLINEGQPVGGVKNDHDFDEGRWGVMKAVNVGEQIGQDGKYVDDMESGVAVKKLHGLDEIKNSEKYIMTFKNCGKVGMDEVVSDNVRELLMLVKKHGCEWFMIYHNDRIPHYPEIKNLIYWYDESKNGLVRNWINGMIKKFPELSHKRIKSIDSVNEISASGAAGGYQTPFAFSKKKSGSQRAMDVTTKMGFKKVKDID